MLKEFDKFFGYFECDINHIMMQGDIGHDLTTINLLLGKHKTLETEILGHESTLQVGETTTYGNLSPRQCVHVWAPNLLTVSYFKMWQMM